MLSQEQIKLLKRLKESVDKEIKRGEGHSFINLDTEFTLRAVSSLILILL